MLATGGSNPNDADAILKTLQAIADPEATQAKVKEWAEREADVRQAEDATKARIQTMLAEADIRAEEIDTEARKAADDLIAKARAKASDILKDATDTEAALDKREEEADAREFALSEREKAAEAAMVEASEMVDSAKVAVSEADAIKVRSHESLERLKAFYEAELNG